MYNHLKALCTLWVFNSVTASYFHIPSYIEILPPDLKNETDFGFSMTYQRNSNLLVIGAPHHDLNGQIFAVSLDNVFVEKTVSSFRVDMDVDKLASDYNRTYADDLNFCLGGSLAVTGDKLVSCAPLWTSTMGQGYGAYGSCFVSDINSTSDFQAHELLRQSRPKSVKIRYGGVGWHTMLDGDKGIFISMSPMHEQRFLAYLNISNPSLPIEYLDMWRGTDFNDEVKPPVKNLGSAFASGAFFGRDTVYAFTEQTNTNVHGVKFFTLKKKRGKLYRDKENFPELSDLKVGSLFGTTLCAVDLNLDNFTDLLVGAPALGSDEYYDSGALHIYLGGEKTEQMKDRRWTILMNKSGARFGTAIAASDLDGDKIAEIFVSGPFEDSGEGAVYILSGSEIYDIINKTQASSEIPLSTLQFTQRIQNRQFKGFGYSLQVLSDLDDNGYNEVAVGAKTSGKVLLYRSTTPVFVNVTCSIGIEYVSEQAKNFSVQVDVRVLNPDKKIINEGNITLTVLVAVDGNGAKLENGDEYDIHFTPTEHVHSKNVTVTLSTEQPGLYKFNATVKSDIDKYLSDEKFSKSRVRIVSSSKSVDTLKIDRRCEGEECVPRLFMDFEWSGGTDTYVLGSSTSDTFSIRVQNAGNTTYSSCAKVLVTGSTIASIEGTKDDSDWYECLLPQLDRYGNYTIKVQLDMSKQTNLDRQLVLEVLLYNTCNVGKASSSDGMNITYKLNPDALYINRSSAYMKIITDSAIADENMKSFVADNEFTVVNEGSVSWKSISAIVQIEKKVFIDEYKVLSIEKACPKDSESDSVITFNCTFDLERFQRMKIKTSVNIIKEKIVDNLIDGQLNITSTLMLHLAPTDVIKNETLTTFINYQKEITVGQNKDLVLLIVVVLAALVLAVITCALIKKGFFKRKEKDKLNNLKRSIRRSGSVVPAERPNTGRASHSFNSEADVLPDVFKTN